MILQAHTHQFLGTFGAPGNGDYHGDLRRATQVITSYAAKLGLLPSSVLLRLDGLYGDAAPLLDVLTAGPGVIARSRAYHLLDLEGVKQVLARAPVHVSTHSESSMTRALYDCSAVPLTPAGPHVRLVVATHPATSSSPEVGIERDGTVYELFVSTLPSPAFTASDVLDLYLHRGSFEIVLADEDDEQNADRWYSHTPCGQEFAQILAQWIWNLRLELGQQLSETSLRTTEFAPALEAESPSTDEPEPAKEPIPAVIYGPPQWARPSFTHGFPGSAFTPQPDGTLRCPANHPLYPLAIREQRAGPMHRHTAISLNSLARLYQDQGKYEEAEPLFQRALSIRKHRLGADHPDTTGSLRHLARLYTDQKKWAKTEVLYRRALAIYEQKFGSLYPDIARSLDGLARLFELQEKYEEAAAFARRALTTWENVFGVEHPQTETARATYERLRRSASGDVPALKCSENDLHPFVAQR